MPAGSAIPLADVVVETWQEEQVALMGNI